jgi:hypothetical protein
MDVRSVCLQLPFESQDGPLLDAVHRAALGLLLGHLAELEAAATAATATAAAAAGAKTAGPRRAGAGGSGRGGVGARGGPAAPATPPPNPGEHMVLPAWALAELAAALAAAGRASGLLLDSVALALEQGGHGGRLVPAEVGGSKGNL